MKVAFVCLNRQIKKNKNKNILQNYQNQLSGMFHDHPRKGQHGSITLLHSFVICKLNPSVFIGNILRTNRKTVSTLKLEIHGSGDGLGRFMQTRRSSGPAAVGKSMNPGFNPGFYPDRQLPAVFWPGFSTHRNTHFRTSTV